MILNTSNAPPGKHWVGLFRSNGEQVLYDSFGRKQGAAIAGNCGGCGSKTQRRRLLFIS
jgi:hypothetical protein